MSWVVPSKLSSMIRALCVQNSTVRTYMQLYHCIQLRNDHAHKS